MSITVNVSGLCGRVSVELPSGATVADAREAAEINDGLQVRCAGHPVPDDAELSDGQQLVTAPPAAKHGSVG
ncbi:MAG TPA: hypothetical protein VGY76_10620 [Solirubrobacteraceae bacterium]|jgi:hypothetical protein|nr:hypothetical protein [Solirubrobacteraceae bacterium]